MVYVHFLKNWDYRESEFATIAYSAGMEIEVDDDCAALAVASKCAIYSDIAEDDLIEGRASDHEDDDA